MTEEEAKQKWCPMVRLEGDYSDELGANRSKSGRIPDAACCIGSDCMMWRKEYEKQTVAQENGIPTTEWVVIGGYCGLGGKP